MNVIANQVDQHQVTLTITVDEKEVTKAVKQAVKQIASQVNIPGFRKGKAPRKVLEMQYGKGAILDEALNILVNKTYGEALSQAAVTPVTDPEIETVTFEEGKALEYKATITKKPEVTLGEYKGLDITKDEAVVTDEDVKKQLDNIRQQHANMVVAEEGTTLANDDFAVIDFAGTVDGTPFDGGEGKSYPLQIGSGNFIPGFEEQLIGAKSGDDVTVKVSFPADYFVADLAGKEAEFKVHIHDIKRKELPVLDDAFAKEVSAYETMGELEADLRKKLQADAEKRAVENYNSEIIKTVVENSSVDIPEVMIEERIDNMLQELDMNLSGRGMNLNSYLKMLNKTEEDLRTDYKETAAENVKTDLVLEAVAAAEDIKVTPDDMNFEIYTMAQNFGADPKDVWDIIVKEGRVAMLSRTVSRKKAASLIVNSVKGAPSAEAEVAEAEKSE